MKILLGEVRQIGIEVFNNLDQDFEIEAADYEIISRQGNQIEKGIPTVKGNQIFSLFSATERGVFYIIFKYHIGPEILKARILVEVI